MNNRLIISDFDGVIGDSLNLCLRITGQIASLFENGIDILTFDGYRHYLGKASALPSLTEDNTSALREVHRLLMRRYAEDIPVFDGVINVYKKLIQRPLISSSSYEGTIVASLGNRRTTFGKIYGCDLCSKEETLAALKEQVPFIYVTDTKTDVERCHILDIPVIATVWGYDTRATLESSKPDYLVSNTDELAHLFDQLKLTK
jgi:phosphoglycolate phosphatase-like HAD superfamily hydrolase